MIFKYKGKTYLDVFVVNVNNLHKYNYLIITDRLVFGQNTYFRLINYIKTEDREKKDRVIHQLLLQEDKVTIPYTYELLLNEGVL